MKFSIPFLLLLPATVGLRPPVETKTAPVRRPNIVMVMADQWRGQAVSCMGNRDVITPNLDKLALESVNARARCSPNGYVFAGVGTYPFGTQ